MNSIKEVGFRCVDYTGSMLNKVNMNRPLIHKIMAVVLSLFSLGIFPLIVFGILQKSIGIGRGLSMR